MTLEELATEAIDSDGTLLCVIKSPRSLSQDLRDAIRDEWRRLTDGNNLEGVPVIVIDSGMEIELISVTSAELRSLEKRIAELESGTLRSGGVQ